MNKYATRCSREFQASKSSGTRPLGQILWIVMHDTEGGTAKGIAEYFASRNAQGSAHLVIDDKECYRCLTDSQVPWGAPGANVKGFHIEQCGYARWSTVIWKKHIQTLNRAAYKAAFHCHKFNIPPVFVTAKGLRNGQKGITTHKECTKAFGGTHTDPGPMWPRKLFMFSVRRFLSQMRGPGGV